MCGRVYVYYSLLGLKKYVKQKYSCTLALKILKLIKISGKTQLQRIFFCFFLLTKDYNFINMEYTMGYTVLSIVCNFAWTGASY